MNTTIHNMLLCIFVVIFGCKLGAQSALPFRETYKEACIARLSEAIQIKTISAETNISFDSSAFTALRLFMEKRFPLIHQTFERIIINDFSYIYKWQGKDSLLPPYILMAHQDVVPVEKAAISSWTYPAFSGMIANDTIWGRGTVDNKGTLVAILEAAENLLQKNMDPERTIYFCFGQDEETSGNLGGKAMAAWFKENAIRPALVLDEGLEIIHRNYIPLKKPLALIGVGEKGYATFELTANIRGGHSAAPEKETAIDILINALQRIHDNPMKSKVTHPVDIFLKKIKPFVSGKMRFAINHQWLFGKKMLKEMGKNNGTNSLVRTTMVTTILSSGIKDNVIPSFAKATINCRILPGESVDMVETHIRNQIKDPRIDLHRDKNSWDPPLQTSIESKAYKTIEKLVTQLMPEVEPVPLIVVGTTDARYFHELSDGVINFLPVIDSKGMHGIDERRSVKDYMNLIRFFEMLITEK